MCYLLFAIAYIIDPLTILYACYKILRPKYQSKVPYIGGVLAVYACIIIKQILMFSDSFSQMGILLYPAFIITLFVFSKLLFDGNCKDQIMIVLSIVIIEAIMEGITIIILSFINIPLSYITSISLKGGLLAVFVRTLNAGIDIAFFNFILYRRTRKRENNIRVVIGYCIISILYLVVATFYVGGGNLFLSYFLFGFQVTMIIVFSYYILHVMIQKDKSKLEAMNKAELIEQQLLITDHAKEVTKKLRTLRHDMNAHYICLRSLLQNEMYDQALDYINELCSDVEESKDICITDNYVLSVLISNKAEECRKKSIKFNRMIMTDELPISYSEQNSLLSNILNNAIEAVEKLPETESRVIDLEIAPLPKGAVRICCMNTTNEKPVIMYNSQKKFITTKKDKKNHGLGVAAMKKIIKDNGGLFSMDYINNNFILTIELVRREETSSIKERQIIS